MRYAICNETFEGWDHPRVCSFVASLGYEGLELAPFTLAPRITDVPGPRRRLLREQARDAGLTLVGRAKGRRFVAVSGAERIIFDSDPQAEEAETRLKAAAMFTAIRRASSLVSSLAADLRPDS